MLRDLMRRPKRARQLGQRDPLFLDLFDAFEDMFETVWPVNWGRQGFDIDVEETEEAYVLTADLPGVTKDDLNIEVEDGVMTITCERHDECRSVKEFEEGGKNFRIRERRCGKYVRRFSLPSVDEQSIDAALKDGVLTLTMKKLPDATRRKVEVKSDEPYGHTPMSE